MKLLLMFFFLFSPSLLLSARSLARHFSQSLSYSSFSLDIPWGNRIRSIYRSDNLLIVEVKANAFVQSAHHLIVLDDFFCCLLRFSPFTFPTLYINVRSPSSSDLICLIQRRSDHVNDAHLSKWFISILCSSMAICLLQSSFIPLQWEISFDE